MQGFGIEKLGSRIVDMRVGIIGKGYGGKDWGYDNCTKRESIPIVISIEHSHCSGQTK